MSAATRTSFDSIGCGSHRTHSCSFGSSCLLFSASSINRCTADSLCKLPALNDIVSTVSETSLSTSWCVDDIISPCCKRKACPFTRFRPRLLRCRYSCIFLISASVRSGWLFRHGATSKMGNGMFRITLLFSSAYTMSEYPCNVMLLRSSIIVFSFVLICKALASNRAPISPMTFPLISARQ